MASEGEAIINATDVNKEIMLRGAREFEVQHLDGSKETLQLPEDIDYALFKSGAMKPFDYRIRTNEIDSILPEEKSTSVGILQKGDKLITIAGNPITYFDETVAVLYANKGKEVDILIKRDGQELTKTVQVSDLGTIGFARKEAKPCWIWPTLNKLTFLLWKAFRQEQLMV